MRNNGSNTLIHFLSSDNIISRVSRSTPRSIFMPTIYIFLPFLGTMGVSSSSAIWWLTLILLVAVLGGGQKSSKLSFSFRLTDLAVGKLEITEGNWEQKGNKWLNGKLKCEYMLQQHPVEICFMGHLGGLESFSVFFLPVHELNAKFMLSAGSWRKKASHNSQLLINL